MAIWTILSFLFFSVSLSAQNTLETPYTLSFGRNSVYASRFNSSGSIEVTKYSLPQSYEKLYLQALQDYNGFYHEVPEPAGASEVFRDAIHSVTRHLPPESKYFGAYIPSMIPLVTIETGSNPLFPEDELPSGGGYSWRAAEYAYEFLQCKNLDRNPEECDEEGPMSMFIYLEYEKDSLYAWLMFVDWDLGGYNALHKQLCRECGEEGRGVHDDSHYIIWWSVLLTRF